MARPTLRERIERKIRIDANGCWIWTGCTQTNGYGSIGTGGRGRTMLVHRAAYTVFKGPIPEGMQLDHACHTADLNCAGGKSCHHRRCANPAHLDVVTQDENRRRALPLGVPGNLRPICVRGHKVDVPGQRCQVCAPVVDAFIEQTRDSVFDWAEIDRLWAEQVKQHFGTQ